MLSVNINHCTQDQETCPVVEKLFEYDAFEAIVEPLEPNATRRREIFGSFVTACVNGNCPGRDPLLANQLLRQRRGEDDE